MKVGALGVVGGIFSPARASIEAGGLLARRPTFSLQMGFHE
jgi:hypothetical protein